jgi:pyruvate carboxylase subunit B
MKRKEIKLSLVYRDMWQSSGKYVPRVDQLVRVAEPIAAMGCFHRVETNGGGFEQVNLLYGENPNVSVRNWTQPFNDAGIQTHMLERGLNALRMSPVSLDVRRMMFKLKKIQGTDISRSFDGLNNPQNLAKSFEFAKEGGMIAQGALSITVSPIHTIEYYVKLAGKYIDLGAEEICIKDMAGIGRPSSIGKIVKGIRKRHPNIIIQYHGHSTPGFSIASSLEAARNGADYVDVGMEPLSWGTGHADLLAVREMLVDDGFLVADINMSAYMEARSLTQEFIDDFLGEYISPSNRKINSLLIGPGLPGGMMGSLMADLENNLKSVNNWLVKNGKEELSKDQLLIKLFDEVEYAWPKLGYPPLVTPFSQYVKNASLMNAIQVIKGKERWSMLDENTWGMILGKSGQLPGEVHEELKNLAKEQNRQFYLGNPQDLYPDVLDEFRAKMKEKGWDVGQDQEELFEYAMHPTQYEDYMSGAAKERFKKDLEARRSKKDVNNQKTISPTAASQNFNLRPTVMDVEVDGQKYRVNISYPNGQNQSDSQEQTASVNRADTSGVKIQNGATNDIGTYIDSPLEGKFFLTKNSGERGVQVGDKVEKGDTIAYIEAMKVINAITADKSGTVSEILVNHGDEVEEDDHLIKLS